MNQEPIDHLLGRLRLAPRPTAPDLRREVRATIRTRRTAYGSPDAPTPFYPWKGVLLQPWIAVGSVAVALLVGSLPGVLTLLRAQPEAEAAYARKSLHLEFFSPAGLLPTGPATNRLSPR